MMALTFISIHTYSTSIYLAVNGAASAVLNWFATLWHGIKDTASWIYHLPVRLGAWIAHTWNAMVHWLAEVCDTILRFVLHFVGAVIAIMVLVAAIRITIWLWHWSKRSKWRDHAYLSIHTRDNQQPDRLASRRFSRHGSGHGAGSQESVAADYIREHFRAYDYGTFGRNLYADTPYRQEQNQRTENNEHQHQAPQARPANNDTNQHEANVRRQQARQKAAQAAQEEQERRRANARQKLARAQDERTYQRWKKSCDEAFESPSTAIPQPPTWTSHIKGCKPLRGSVACTCSVARLLSAGIGGEEGFKGRQKQEIRRWHPDKLYFTSRPGRGPSWVEEFFKAILNAEEWRY